MQPPRSVHESDVKSSNNSKKTKWISFSITTFYFFYNTLILPKWNVPVLIYCRVVWQENIMQSSCHWTKMYPMALVRLSPLSPPYIATFPVVTSTLSAPIPIIESQVMQLFSLIPKIPILAFMLVTTLKPSLLQLICKEAFEPIKVFHVLRPSEVARYCPSAISEYRESACLLMTMKLIFRSVEVFHSKADFGEGCVPVSW